MEKTPEVTKAISLVDEIIPLVEDAEAELTSAQTWSFVDILGGGLITDIIKHSKLNNASASMDRVNYLMQDLQATLKSVAVPQDYSMTIGGFATFADFFFDGFLMDAYMMSKIFESVAQVRELKDKLYQLKHYLVN